MNEGLDLFGNDPWWLTLLKAVGILVYLLLITIFNIVYERKALAKMQHRVGPRMNGPRGWFQTLADGLKLMLKEDFRPREAEYWVFNLAPYLVAIPAFSVFALIPMGGEVTIFGVQTSLQLTDLPVAVLAILGLASVGIYGIVLAGWSSGSTYSLLGGLRSSAQMISYEIAMGLSFVTVFMYAGSMSTSEIVAAQQLPMNLPFVGEAPIPSWYWLILLPSFIIYVISMFGETNRLPFDLPESEGELVGGFHTEYSGFRFAMFYLGEYINMVNVSAIATTLFLGGWHAPWPINPLLEGTAVGNVLLSGWFGLVWFTIKVLVLIFLFIWVRGSLPRFRYDQFMKLGWRVLIPVSLLWISLVAIMRSLTNVGAGWHAGITIVFTFVAVLLFLFFGFDPNEVESEPVDHGTGTDFDPYAGGYPIPPKEGQELPERAMIVQPVPDREPDPDAEPDSEQSGSAGSGDEKEQ